MEFLAKNGQTYFSIRPSEAVDHKVLYHGSSLSFDLVQPSFSVRMKAEKINWVGTAIFATPDRRIALFYTYRQSDGYLADIDLVRPIEPDKPVDFLLIGGSSQEDALDHLYGPSDELGFIYHFDGQRFVKESGLGAMEAISYDPDSTIDKEAVFKRKEIQRYVDLGLINLVWIPQ